MKIRIRRHYVNASIWLLALLEACVLFASVYYAAEIRFLASSHEDVLLLGPLYLRASVITLIMLTILTVFGLYQAEYKHFTRKYFMLMTASFVIGFILLTVLFYLVPQLYLGRGVFVIAMGLSYVSLLVLRVIYGALIKSDTGKKQILVLGTGSRNTPIGRIQQSRNDNSRFQIVGYVPSGSVDDGIDKSLLLDTGTPLLAHAQKKQVDEIVVGVRQRRGGNLDMRELLECRMEGIPVVGLSTFYEREMGKVLLDSLNPSWFVFGDGFDRGNLRNITKRAFDLTASLALFLLTSPIMLATAILIKLESKGPVFYSQRRVGECGFPFDVLKFRSMSVDAEKHGAQWAQKNDPRVTRVGRIIRLLRIDELPQIINVINGDMSFVGPRPERPEFVKDLARQIPYYAARHSVKPGITGWAQVNYPYGASLEDARSKLEYDLYYAKNHTLFLDLIVLFQTAQVVLFGKGAR